MFNSSDTIAAISSAVGPAARLIVRMSGPQAHAITQSLAPALRIEPASDRRTTLHFSDLSVHAWVYVFVSPRSYTGEDAVELHIPGNVLLARMLLDELIRRGARSAEAGEFTARAYFNGRLDLTAAEGVAAMVSAQSEGELRAARQLLAGELARRLRPMLDLLAETLALVEVGIDFTDEDVTFLAADEVIDRARRVDRDLADLLANSSRFERLTHEPRIVLVGRPNAGKSTLLNALAGHERAVVSSQAGTTRDALSAEVRLRRGIVQLIDVAGLDASIDHEAGSVMSHIERQMRGRALRMVEQADIVIAVRDAAETGTLPDLPRPADMVVETKSDLCPRTGAPEGAIRVSALTGANMDALRERLDELAFGAMAREPDLALNARHLAAVDEARAALARAVSHASHEGAEIVALDLRESLDALGRILGQVTPDDLLGRIFSRFCIGK